MSWDLNSPEKPDSSTFSRTQAPTPNSGKEIPKAPRFPNVPSHKSVRMSTAEELKALGNKAIAAKDFDEAM